MRSQRNNRLREMQLAFIGKLMAGLSHEFKNHLAIIKELNGLIEDLLMLEEPGESANSERYKKITSGINERIAQAAEMCRFLSGFSHRMDQPLLLGDRGNRCNVGQLHRRVGRRFGEDQARVLFDAFAHVIRIRGICKCEAHAETIEHLGA